MRQRLGSPGLVQVLVRLRKGVVLRPRNTGLDCRTHARNELVVWSSGVLANQRTRRKGLALLVCETVRLGRELARGREGVRTEEHSHRYTGYRGQEADDQHRGSAAIAVRRTKQDLFSRILFILSLDVSSCQ